MEPRCARYWAQLKRCAEQPAALLARPLSANLSAAPAESKRRLKGKKRRKGARDEVEKGFEEAQVCAGWVGG